MSRVLIIEDEKAMGNLISIRFKVQGFEVDHVSSLQEAKEKIISNGSYDAMLTDYLLPDGDLIEFLTQLRNNPPTKNMPVIVMTNYIEDLNIDKLKSLGVNDILVKYQIVPAQMVETVRQMITINSNT